MNLSKGRSTGTEVNVLPLKVAVYIREVQADTESAAEIVGGHDMQIEAVQVIVVQFIGLALVLRGVHRDVLLG